MACRIRAGGGAERAARVIDLSEGGASIAEAPAMAQGSAGSLLLDTIGIPLPFTVRQAENDVLHIAFRLDDAAAGRLRSVVASIQAPRAA
jgi:hypothetical protein